MLSIAHPLASVISILKVFTWSKFLGFTTLSHLILKAPYVGLSQLVPEKNYIVVNTRGVVSELVTVVVPVTWELPRMAVHEAWVEEKTMPIGKVNLIKLPFGMFLFELIKNVYEVA